MQLLFVPHGLAKVALSAGDPSQNGHCDSGRDPF